MAPPLSSNSPTPGSLRRQRKLRKWHRWLALVTAVQLLLWTLSGAYFAFVDINFVRGANHRVAPGPVALNLADVEWATDEGAELLVRHRLPGELVIGVVGAEATVWHTATGEPLAELNAQEALQLAAGATDLNPDSATLVDEDVVGSEYRGRPLPLWRVFNSEQPSTVAYLDATSGEVVAIRNTAWRWWDFLWSLHIMDYDDRDTIGTMLLKLFSVLAVLTAIMGIALFISLPNKWR